MIRSASVEPPPGPLQSDPPQPMHHPHRARANAVRLSHAPTPLAAAQSPSGTNNGSRELLLASLREKYPKQSSSSSLLQSPPSNSSSWAEGYLPRPQQHSSIMGKPSRVKEADRVDRLFTCASPGGVGGEDADAGVLPARRQRQGYAALAAGKQHTLHQRSSLKKATTDRLSATTDGNATGAETTTTTKKDDPPPPHASIASFDSTNDTIPKRNRVNPFLVRPDHSSFLSSRSSSASLYHPLPHADRASTTVAARREVPGQEEGADCGGNSHRVAPSSFSSHVKTTSGLVGVVDELRSPPIVPILSSSSALRTNDNLQQQYSTEDINHRPPPPPRSFPLPTAATATAGGDPQESNSHLLWSSQQQQEQPQFGTSGSLPTTAPPFPAAATSSGTTVHHHHYDHEQQNSPPPPPSSQQQQQGRGEFEVLLASELCHSSRRALHRLSASRVALLATPSLSEAAGVATSSTSSSAVPLQHQHHLSHHHADTLATTTATATLSANPSMSNLARLLQSQDAMIQPLQQQHQALLTRTQQRPLQPQYLLHQELSLALPTPLHHHPAVADAAAAEGGVVAAPSPSAVRLSLNESFRNTEEEQTRCTTTNAIIGITTAADTATTPQHPPLPPTPTSTLPLPTIGPDRNDVALLSSHSFPSGFVPTDAAAAMTTENQRKEQESPRLQTKQKNQSTDEEEVHSTTADAVMASTVRPSSASTRRVLVRGEGPKRHEKIPQPMLRHHPHSTGSGLALEATLSRTHSATGQSQRPLVLAAKERTQKVRESAVEGKSEEGEGDEAGALDSWRWGTTRFLQTAANAAVEGSRNSRDAGSCDSSLSRRSMHSEKEQRGDSHNNDVETTTEEVQSEEEENLFDIPRVFTATPRHTREQQSTSQRLTSQGAKNRTATRTAPHSTTRASPPPAGSVRTTKATRGTTTTTTTKPHVHSTHRHKKSSTPPHARPHHHLWTEKDHTRAVQASPRTTTRPMLRTHAWSTDPQEPSSSPPPPPPSTSSSGLLLQQHLRLMETFLPHHQLTEAEGGGGGGASYYLRTPHTYRDDDPEEEEEDSVEYASVAEQEPNKNEDMCRAALVGEQIGLPLGVNGDSQQILVAQSAHHQCSTRGKHEDKGVPYHLLSAPHHTPAQQWYHQYLDVRRRYL